MLLKIYIYPKDETKSDGEKFTKTIINGNEEYPIKDQ
jgi:hypothetical protein